MPLPDTEPDPGHTAGRQVWLTFAGLLAFAAGIMVLFGVIIFVLWRRYEASLG